ncbi:hypothetical protein OIU74_024560 [Salix koriyanagi]|uniref:Uncharacterized protein n=1 Tax=Salix koriyanagi TaxID=2511006 RepID=A0A9Q0W741_9ROSI|nr:hypothetical protein OIU74_024560 [Salix koriyanagi]
MELHNKITTPACQEPGQVNLSSQEALFSNFDGGFEQSKRKPESKTIRGVTEEGRVLELLRSLLARQQTSSKELCSCMDSWRKHGDTRKSFEEKTLHDRASFLWRWILEPIDDY